MLKENYENLSNAVVERAAKDYKIFYKHMCKKHIYEIPEDLSTITEIKDVRNRNGNVVDNGISAFIFLNSDDLKLFSEVDGKYIINQIQKTVRHNMKKSH